MIMCFYFFGQQISEDAYQRQDKICGPGAIVSELLISICGECYGPAEFNTPSTASYRCPISEESSVKHMPYLDITECFG